MTIKEIYEAFDKIGCLSFATVNEFGEPESRIAHLRAFDDDGIYFMTMFVKDFYKQMKNVGKVSVSGFSGRTEIGHDANGFPIFDGGYAIRMTGEVEEVPIEKIKEKNNPIFDFCIKDKEKYPGMVVMCITSAYGDIFDNDFRKESRENKLERTYFAFGNATVKYKGLFIDENKCIGCGNCKKACSFLAIKNDDGRFEIDKNRCDECADCFLNCPVGAISYTKAVHRNIQK